MFLKSRSDWHSLDWSGAEHYRYCCQWMEKASPCLSSHSRLTLQAILLQAVEKLTTGWIVSQSVRNVNKMFLYALCYLSNHIALNKKVIFRWFVFSPGSAETNVSWGGKLNGQLMLSCVRNIPTNNYQNLILGFQLTVENVGYFFLGHSVVGAYSAKLSLGALVIKRIQSIGEGRSPSRPLNTPLNAIDHHG